MNLYKTDYYELMDYFNKNSNFLDSITNAQKGKMETVENFKDLIHQVVFYYLKVNYNKLNPKATVEKNKINK